MKKKSICISLVLIVLISGIAWFAPKTFGYGINTNEVDHINIFDGRTAIGFTVSNPEDIAMIVSSIQGISMKRTGIALNRKDYWFSISFIDEKGNDLVPIFFIDGIDTIQKTPFLYRCDDNLFVDYLMVLERNFLKGEEK